MNYAALAAEIAKPAYEGLGDAEMLAALNAKTVAVAVPVLAGDVRRLLMVAGRWPRIAAIARGLIPAADDNQALAAVALVEALAAIESFDLEVPAYAAAVDAQLDAAVATGLIEAGHKAAILALGQAQKSWVLETHGIVALSVYDLDKARAA